MRRSRRIPVHVLVRRQRLKLGLRQIDLAGPLGCTAEAIGMLEAGRRRIHLEKVPALGRLLRFDEGAFCLYALAEYYPRLHAGLLPRLKPPAF